jgi:hypothetical protein
MAKGGVREGAGRPSKVDEERVRTLAVSAIEAKHGSLEKGFKALLDTMEPVLMKFVWEHAVGKPKENVNLSGTGIVFKLKKPGDKEEAEE